MAYGCRRFHYKKICCLRHRFHRLYIAVNLLLRCLSRNGKIIVGLEVNPELGRSAEEASQPKGHLRGDAAFLPDDVIYVWRSHAQSESELVWVQIERDHELLAKNLTGVSWL